MSDPLNDLASAVGDFIRFWGFRRIHGQIWTVVYLSKAPLSGADLVRQLGVSKALISDALHELVAHGLLESEPADGRTVLYRANSDVFGIIKNILAGREAVLIQAAKTRFDALRQRAGSSQDAGIDPSRLTEIGSLIHAALVALKVVDKTPQKGPLAYWKFLSQARSKS